MLISWRWGANRAAGPNEKREKGSLRAASSGCGDVFKLRISVHWDWDCSHNLRGAVPGRCFAFVNETGLHPWKTPERGQTTRP